jgi:hypothetical protein
LFYDCLSYDQTIERVAVMFGGDLTAHQHILQSAEGQLRGDQKLPDSSKL